jgi:hypothetical protein
MLVLSLAAHCSAVSAQVPSMTFAVGLNFYLLGREAERGAAHVAQIIKSGGCRVRVTCFSTARATSRHSP